MSGAKSRTVPMEVLVLGLCRTGTMSIKIALRELGYGKVYHFSSLFHEPTHVDLWTRALEAKYGTETDIPSSHWDKILGEYGAVTDIPCAVFAAELMTAYPNAKIILTTRSTATWHTSMLRTIHALYMSRLNRFLLLFANADPKAMTKLLDLIIAFYFKGDIKKYGKQVFDEHNERVKMLAQEQVRDLLVYKIGEGWEPLCAFLGKEMPQTEFPRVNDTKDFRVSFGLDLGLAHLGLAAAVGFLAIVVWFILPSTVSR